MAFTIRDITEGLFKNGYAWTGHPTKDKALVWAKTGVVQPGGNTVVASAALVIPITTSSVTKTTGGAEELTLANGTAGQVLTVSITAASGTGSMTPATATGFVSIEFIAAGDVATLMYVDDTVGWIVLGTAGVTAPPALKLT